MFQHGRFDHGYQRHTKHFPDRFSRRALSKGVFLLLGTTLMRSRNENGQKKGLAKKIRRKLVDSDAERRFIENKGEWDE